jgi:putative NADPH-quinone reductase
LLYGFAYGKTGDKLKGKNLLLSFSTGGPQEAYMHGGRNNFEIEELLYPLKQTSNLIGTNWMEPVVSFGMVNIRGIDIDKTTIIKKATEHAQKLYDILHKL